MKRTLPGSYQRLDLFIKVLRVLCPNVTAAFRRYTSSISGLTTMQCPGLPIRRLVFPGFPSSNYWTSRHKIMMTGPRSDELERYPRSDRFQRTSQAIGRWRMRDEGQDRSSLPFSHPSIILEETLRSDPNMMNMPKNSGSLLPL